MGWDTGNGRDLVKITRHSHRDLDRQVPVPDWFRLRMAVLDIADDPQLVPRTGLTVVSTVSSRRWTPAVSDQGNIVT